MAKSQKGKKQYTNPVREAIERTSGRAYAGTRASASNRIKNDSQLRKSAGTTTYTRTSTSDFYKKLGVSEKKQPNARILRVRNATRTVHRADRRDPNTGFGMNIRQNRRYRVSMSGS